MECGPDFLTEDKTEKYFYNRENGFGEVDKSVLWQVLGMSGVKGKLLKEVQSPYEGATAVVRVIGVLNG